MSAVQLQAMFPCVDTFSALYRSKIHSIAPCVDLSRLVLTLFRPYEKSTQENMDCIENMFVIWSVEFVLKDNFLKQNNLPFDIK